MEFRDKVNKLAWYIPIRKVRYLFRDIILHNYNSMRRLTPQAYINSIEIDIASHCNLNCYGCSHFSHLSDENYYDFNIFEKDIIRMSELSNGLINILNIMGGEPLLNKRCNEYFDTARKYFPNSIIKLLTNGILLLQQNNKFWESCSKNKIVREATKYNIKIDWDKIKEKCDKYDITFNFHDGSGENEKNSIRFGLSSNRKFDAFDSFTNCGMANNCIQLKNGKLYTCNIIPGIEYFNKYYGKNLEVTELDYIDIYKVKDYKEMLYLLSKPVPFCSYCDVDNWKIIGTWRRSTKNINEYIDDEDIK